MEEWANLDELARRPPPQHHRLRWFIPDLALCLAAITIFYGLIFFNAPQKLFRDSGAGRQIETGELLISARTLPQTDPYSFTRAGEPWIGWDWGSSLLIGAANHVAGLSGVVCLFVLAIAAVTWFWVRLNRAAGGNFFLTCVLAIPMLATVSSFWLARPSVFAWILLLWLLAYFETAQPRFGLREAALLASISALWANLQPSFLLAPAIACLYAAAYAVRPLIWNLDTPLEFLRARWFLFAGAVCLAGSALNPYGFALHLHVLRYLFGGGLRDAAGLWPSLNLAALITLGIAAAGGVLALLQKRLEHFLLSVGLLGAALLSRWALPIAALCLLPLANGVATEALRRVQDVRPALRRKLHSFLLFSDRLQLLEARFSGLVWTPFWVFMIYGWLNIPLIAGYIGFSPARFPVYAASELTLLPGNIRLLAPEQYNDYLIYRFQGRRKVFFDGRADLYGREFKKNYAYLMEARPGWLEQVHAGRFTHALLPRESPLAASLEQAGWKVLFRDDTATLLQRPAG